MALLRFAKFYKFVYELPPDHRPADAIIESDARVDQWYDAWVKRTEREYLKARRGTHTGHHRRESDTNRIPEFTGNP
jgi:hypothetical protein